MLLDRYTLYNRAFKSDIISILDKNKTVVLIDCKTILELGLQYKLCTITMESNKIEIW